MVFAVWQIPGHVFVWLQYYCWLLLQDADRLERINAAKESLKRVKLGGPDNIAPSVCFYTFTNSFGSVSAIDICDDSSLLAAGRWIFVMLLVVLSFVAA